MQNHQRIGQLLLQLEQEMRDLSVWSDAPPERQAFASTLPFCYDRMEFHEWLQWVFVPKIFKYVELGSDFQGKCEIAPMAEVWFERKQTPHAFKLIRILHELDRQLST